MKETTDAVEILKKRYIGNDPEKKKLLGQARIALQTRIDAKLELEMIPIRKANDIAIIHASIFGMLFVGLLAMVKYGLLPLLLL